MLFAALFIVAVLAFTALAFFRHPIYAVYFYLVSIYVFPSGRWWGQIFGGTRWALLSAVVVALAILAHRGKLKPKPHWLASVPAVVMVLYAAWMWIQSPWAMSFNEHIDGAARFSKYVLAFWFVYRVADTKERVRDVLFAHMLGCTLLGLLCMVQGRVDDRLDGVGGPGMDDANTLGMYLATGAIVGLGLLITQRGWWKFVAFLACVIILEGLVLTNTRGAFLALVGGWVAMAALTAKAHRRWFWGLALFGLVGLAVIVDKAFVERMWTIRESGVDSEDVDPSARSRLIVARAQLKMFFDHPMGSGHRGTVALSRYYLEDRWLTFDAEGADGGRASHNTFLTTLAEQGAPGALLFLWLTLWTLIAFIKLRSRETVHRDPELTTMAATVAGVLAVVFVAGNTADYLMAEVQFWMFALVVTLRQLAEQPAPATSPAQATTPAAVPALSGRG
jgi:hypothetical protein